VDVSDWPAVAHRAVIWSYRRHCRSTFARLEHQFDLFSRLHINTILLLVDTKNLPFVEDNPSDASVEEILSESVAEEELCAEVFSLDDMARKRCIGVVPTHVITSIHQKYRIFAGSPHNDTYLFSFLTFIGWL
jgi:hypothetical protein